MIFQPAAHAHVDNARVVSTLAFTTGGAVVVAAALLFIQGPVIGADVVAPTPITVGAGGLVGVAWFALLTWPPQRWSIRERRPLGRAVTATAIGLRACAEEVAWRGSLLALDQIHGHGLVWNAAMSVGFGVVHDRRHGRLGLVATGVVFGALVLVTDDVISACVAHTVFNIAAFNVVPRHDAPLVATAPATCATSLVFGPPPGFSAQSTRRPVSSGQAAVTSNEAPFVVEWSDVFKRLGRSQALAGFSLTVRRGDITAVLGPNGAGKTTAISLALGLRRPDNGTVRVLGLDPRTGRSSGLGSGSASRKLSVGAAPQDVSFPMTMRVRELVEFTRAHYDDPYSVHDVLAWCGITDLAGRQAGGLSGGERRRLALALALAGRPRLVVLDEPTAGLDVDARAALWERLRWFRDHGGSVLLTTHDLTEAEQLADRVAVVDRGRVVATDTPADLRRTLGTSTMRFEVARRALDGLRRVAADATVTSDPAEHSDAVEIVIMSRDTDEVVRRLVGEHVVFRRLRIEEASLEDAIRTMAR